MLVLARLSTAAAAVALLIGASLPLPALAEGKVLARVDGLDITEADIRLAETEIGPNIFNVPPEHRTRVLVEYLIENRMLAAAGEKANLASDPSMDGRMAYYKSRALRDLFFEKNINGAVTEEAAKAIYDQQIAAMKPVEEVKASHILVEKKEEADAILAQIKAGGDFAALAKEKSKDPGSGANGGDLGYFTHGQMVKQFDEMAFKLKPGEISDPVQTQFGWHIIKVEDKRNRPFPPFDKVKDKILTGLLQQKAEEVITGLRKAAKIEYVDEDLKKAAEAASQGQPQQ